jgi:hypothetical protein
MYVLPVIYNIVRRFLLGALRSVGLCPVKPSNNDWMNFVFTVNHGCELILTSDYCYQRFWDFWSQCGTQAGYGVQEGC